MPTRYWAKDSAGWRRNKPIFSGCVLAGEGFSPGKAPSRTLPKSAYREGSFVQEGTAGLRKFLFCLPTWLHMWSSFASFLLTQKKRRPPAGLAAGAWSGGAGGRRLFPGKSPLPHPPEKRIWGRVICSGRDCRFAVVSFCLPTLAAYAVFFCFFSSDTEEKKAPGRAFAAGASCGGFDRKGLPVCGGFFLFANLAAYAVFFCFFSSDTEEKKAPGRACCGGVEWRL